LIMHLLGYKINKEYFAYDRERCIEEEYPTYYHHSGIEGCIFWMRNDYLEKKQSWRSQFSIDTEYCNSKYNKNDFKDKMDKMGDPKCSYIGFKKLKRKENWDYLISEEKDDFYEYCVNQACPEPPLFK